MYIAEAILPQMSQTARVFGPLFLVKPKLILVLSANAYACVVSEPSGKSGLVKKDRYMYHNDGIFLIGVQISMTILRDECRENRP